MDKPGLFRSNFDFPNDQIHPQICAMELPRAGAWSVRLQRRSGSRALPTAVPRYRPAGHHETRPLHLCRVGYGEKRLLNCRKRYMHFFFACMHVLYKVNNADFITVIFKVLFHRNA